MPPEPQSPKPLLDIKANFFRQTPFRLTMVFLAVYIFVALLISGYIFIVTRAETRAFGNSAIETRLKVLQKENDVKGHAWVVDKILSEDASDWIFAKGVFDDSGQILAQNMRARMEQRGLPETLIQKGLDKLKSKGDSVTVTYESNAPNDQSNCCRFQGKIVKLDDDFYVYVAMDMSWADSGYAQLSKALWGGGLLVLIFGLFAGTLINQEVSRAVSRLTNVLAEAQEGNLSARVTISHAGDEFDDLAVMVNQTLGRMEKTLSNLKYAGDAIAHDLRSPLTRLKTRFEVSRKDVIENPDNAAKIFDAALDETDNVLKTFQTVFSISRLQAQGTAPDQKLFDASALGADMAELFDVVAWDKGIGFEAEIAPDLKGFGNRDFLAQALANLLDNALKYTPAGGGVTFRLRKTAQNEIEYSITDNGPGVPLEDRARIIERFVRLENSRTQPGVGLGLSMVQAVAVAHGGRLMIDEGPGVYENHGPGLRTALVLPPIQA